MRRAMAGLVVLLWAGSASAERGELIIGAEGGVLLPSFQEPSDTALTLATWSAGGSFEYGVLHWLNIGTRLTYSQFSAVAENWEVEGLTGRLGFDARVFHWQATTRFKLFGGYNLAPYLELGPGLMWVVYDNPLLLNDSDRVIDDTMSSFGRGAVTLEAGLLVDFRIFNLFTLGTGVRFVKAFDDLFGAYVQVPFKFTFYWFH